MTHMDKTPLTTGPGFEANLQTIPISSILPVKPMPLNVPKSQKYAQIAASIREVGLIEPPVVSRSKGDPQSFILLDGHVRLHVLKEMGQVSVTCLIATDDESFTYNKRITRLATIQEHKMILRAVERGVPESRIAAALNVDVVLIRRKRTLLNGICPEAAELLKAKHCPINCFQSLRKMKPMRQIQAAELMIAANNYSAVYAEAILAATDNNDLVDPAQKKAPPGVTREQAELMKTEMANLQKNIKLIEDTLGPDHLRLVVAGRFVERLVLNERLARYLDKHHGEVLSEFRQIVAHLSQAGVQPDAKAPEVPRSILRQFCEPDGDRDPLSAGTVGEAVVGGGSRAGWGWRRTRSEPTMVGRDIADRVGVQSWSPAMNDGRVANQAGFRMPARKCDAPLLGIRARNLTARVCQQPTRSPIRW